MSKYADLNIDLSKAGLPSFSHMDEVGDPIDTLVNTKTSSKPYLSILLEYLPKLYGNEQEMVIRALSEKGNTDATPYLLDLLSNPTSSTEINLWAIGNALNAIDDKNSYPDIIKLCKNTQLGSARQMLFEIIARIKTEEVFQIIVDSVTDQSVQLHAIQALGKYGDQRGIIILEQIDSKKNKHIEQAVNKAIEKLKLK